MTSHGSGTQIEIQLGHICNNRCVFCVSGQLTEQRLAGTIDTEPVLRELENAAARGAKKVTFLGGEPTLQRSFLPALRRAVDLGFTDIVIFTNGVKTMRRSFVEEIVALGQFTWRFSIQGGNEAAHDEVTKKPGAFARILGGMKNVRDFGQRITANACINEFSYRSLPDYAALAKEYGITQVHIDMIRPSDAGVRTDEYLKSIMPPYSNMAPYFRRMLEGFDEIDPDFDVNVGNYPYCLIPEWAHKVHHDGEETVTFAADGTADGRTELSKGWNKYEVKRVDKRHPPQCEQCVFRPECNGIFDKYALFHGYDEFQPVTRERLRVLDPRMHHFVLLMADELDALVEGGPDGWSPGAVHRNSRDRFIEMAFAAEDGSGAAVTLVFTPPEGVGAKVEAPPAVLEADRFRVGLRIDRRSARGWQATLAAVVHLLRWLARRVDEAPGFETTRPVQPARVVTGFIDPQRVARGRAHIGAAIERARARGLEGLTSDGGPRWRLGQVTPRADWPGAVLRFVPEGEDQDDSIEVVLSVHADPERPPIAVDVRAPDSVGRERASGAVRALLR